MDRIIIVGLGGFLGSVLRYLVAGWTHAILGDRFPWGTLAVNATGCFVLGGLVAAASNGTIGPNARLFLFIGVVGGFTTFSAFGHETLQLIESGRVQAACVSVAANLGLGVSAVWAGASIARVVLTR
jgi:fluoride exporter